MPHAAMKHSTAPLSPNAEVFDPPGGNLNALIKQSAERLLPLLGEQIRLRSFCASGLFPAVISPAQVEDILSRVFVKVREEMQTGGIVLLQTAHFNVPVDSSRDSRGDIGTYVVVNVRYTECETTPYRETSIKIYFPVVSQLDLVGEQATS